MCADVGQWRIEGIRVAEVHERPTISGEGISVRPVRIGIAMPVQRMFPGRTVRRVFELVLVVEACREIASIEVGLAVVIDLALELGREIAIIGLSVVHAVPDDVRTGRAVAVQRLQCLDDDQCGQQRSMRIVDAGWNTRQNREDVVRKQITEYWH